MRPWSVASLKPPDNPRPPPHASTKAKILNPDQESLRESGSAGRHFDPAHENGVEDQSGAAPDSVLFRWGSRKRRQYLILRFPFRILDSVFLNHPWLGFSHSIFIRLGDDL